jgi:hypothetical protein
MTLVIITLIITKINVTFRIQCCNSQHHILNVMLGVVMLSIPFAERHYADDGRASKVYNAILDNED